MPKRMPISTAPMMFKYFSMVKNRAWGALKDSQFQDSLPLRRIGDTSAMVFIYPVSELAST